MNSYIKTMLPFTFISGVLSGVTLLIVPFAFQFGPGVIFGALTAIGLGLNKNLKPAQQLLWLISSTLSWYAAIKFYSMNLVSSGLFNMVEAGVLGAILLAVLFMIIRGQFKPIQLLVTIITGAAGALAMFAILSGEPNSGHYSLTRLAVSFSIWQVLVGYSLFATSKPR